GNAVKILFAALSTETNTFSPIPTGHAAFHGRDYFRSDGSRHPPLHANVALTERRKLAEADGHQCGESIGTSAEPAGTTLRAVYEDLRDTVLADLKAALPVDVV